ncbi:protein of unknown function [Cupriavidus taiwanensis]|nr:protein of unknown function [Cupriavidus taiwanensis]
MNRLCFTRRTALHCIHTLLLKPDIDKHRAPDVAGQFYLLCQTILENSVFIRSRPQIKEYRGHLRH